jgi:hypothetical protein
MMTPKVAKQEAQMPTGGNLKDVQAKFSTSMRAFLL